MVFGVRWLLNRLNLHPNGYYTYKRSLHQSRSPQKQEILDRMIKIYHQSGSKAGYRVAWATLRKEGYQLSLTTAHIYYNKILGLKSTVRPKYRNYSHGEAHTVFPNLLGRNFTAEAPNQRWCIDFTYLFLINGNVRYNCAIIDLYRRRLVASECGNEITAQLAIKTVQKALANVRHKPESKIILHSDQGSQFTSRAFVQFCKRNHIKQSMSQAGCPYDNAPMERYFNTLKQEWVCLYDYKNEQDLYHSISYFAHVYYNYVRPHSYNNYETPILTRYSQKNFTKNKHK